MAEELQYLREQIDQVDKSLLSLLEKRMQLVAEVGEVKNRHGLPIYAPDREALCLLLGVMMHRKWEYLQI